MVIFYNLIISQMIRKDIDRVNREIREKNNEMQTKEFLIRDRRDKLRIFEQKWEERNRKIRNQDELHQEILKMDLEIKAQEEKAAEIYPVLSEKEKELAKFREEKAAEESSKADHLNSLQRSLSQISVLMDDIENYIASDGVNRLGNCIAEIENLTEEIKASKSSMEGITSKIDRMNKQRSEIQVLQRSIDDNLKYRQMIRERDLLHLKLNALKLQLSKFDTETIEIQYNKLKQAHERLVGERAVIYEH